MGLAKDVTGVVLAGGHSRRMGTDKSLLPFQGKPMIRHIVSILQSSFEKVVVASHEVRDYAFLGVPIVQDLHKDCGPLAGVHSALESSSPNPIFVLPCDMPLVTPEVVRHVLHFRSQAPARVLKAGGRIFPLCGWFSPLGLPLMRKSLLERRLRMTDLLQSLRADYVQFPMELGLSDEILRNINTPADLGPPASD